MNLSSSPDANALPESGQRVNAHDTLRALAELARDPSQQVPSPCISVCRMDADQALCLGCFRTIDEIMAWSRASEQDKRSIWRLVAQRAALDQAGTASSAP